MMAAPQLGTKRYIDLHKDKLRGGYYTPRDLAAWLCRWAIRSPSDKVLEPSCGDGSFLTAAAAQLQNLGANPSAIIRQLIGIEIIPEEAKKANAALSRLVRPKAEGIAKIGDFFEWWGANEAAGFDAVIGNPPFIRYQSFPEPHRTRAMSIMNNLGFTPNRLTNIWVPFVSAAIACLKPGGRLAFVLPAELLQVTYAAQLRSFLTDRFKKISLIACNELFFANAEQEVVLLLAEGSLPQASEKNLCKVGLIETGSVSEIINCKPSRLLARSEPKIIRHDQEKWLKYFLTTAEIGFMRELRSSDVTANLSTHASVDVGVVTGKNQFFVLNTEQVKALGLREYTTPLVSRSAHLQGAKLDKTDWRALSASGDRVHLLHLAPMKNVKPKGPLAKYIRAGEENAIHKGYKCSVRAPWYSVPSVWNPEGFMFRQIYDFPRLVLNDAGATSTDTIHRLTCKKDTVERVIANTYTWLTAASAEIEGRSYGGGVLELEPTEAERLLVPAKFNGAMPLKECDQLTRAGRLDDVLEENARVVLKGHLGLSSGECEMLKAIWTKMRDRRMARRRRSRATAAAEETRG